MAKATNKPSPHAKVLLRQFEEAAVAQALRGTQPPEEWQKIEDAYEAAKGRLEEYIFRLQEAQRHVRTPVDYKMAT